MDKEVYRCDFCRAMGVGKDDVGVAEFTADLIDRGDTPGEGLLGYADIDSALCCRDCLVHGFGIDPDSLPVVIREEDGRAIKWSRGL